MPSSPTFIAESGSCPRNAQPEESGSFSSFSIILTGVRYIEKCVTKKPEAFDEEGRAACCEFD